LDRLAHKALKVFPVCPTFPVLKGLSDPQDRKALQVRTLLYPDQQVLRVRQVPKDRRVLKVTQGLRDRKALREIQELQAHKAHKALLVPPARMVTYPKLHLTGSNTLERMVLGMWSWRPEEEEVLTTFSLRMKILILHSTAQVRQTGLVLSLSITVFCAGL
jgi:hypothetical protein